MMRNRNNMSLCSWKHYIESYNVQSESKNYSFQLNDSDFKEDFIEVWINIEKSIRIYELTNKKQNMINKFDKNRTIINLNLEL
jgi:predicted transcriptional regulator